ncbi:MAG: amino acid permease [Actinobacteria bacterium]|nr:amino acid permease [Actinomycetota bacterium]
MPGPPPALERRLGVTDAVVLGLGSMIGAGVFAVWAPAARAAGSGLVLGLAVAAVVAYGNATASAQLAATYPVSGGTYVYGRAVLGPWWGFTAGWGFVVGKTASCAAMALTFAGYVAPGERWVQRLVAAGAVFALVAVNYRGVSKTLALSRVLVAVTLLALAVVIVAAATHAPAGRSGLGATHGGAYSVLQSAGLLFFAFAGYARVATLGEEVREPERTIPRAIPIALGAAAVVYLAVGVTALRAAGPAALAESSAPLVTTVRAAGLGGLVALVRVGAAVAALGALLALVAGIGRTSLAMARERDLPAWLDAVHKRYRVPHHAESALGLVVIALVLSVDLRGVIGFSSFGVLVYYAIANLAAFRQPPEQRRWPRLLNLVGLTGCLTLVSTLPWPSVASGVAVFAVGLGGRALVLTRRRRQPARR